MPAPLKDRGWIAKDHRRWRCRSSILNGMTVDTRGGEADWLGKSLQIASLIVRVDSVTMLGVLPQDIRIVRHREVGRRLRLREYCTCLKYRLRRCQCEVPGRAQMVGRDFLSLRRLIAAAMFASSFLRRLEVSDDDRTIEAKASEYEISLSRS